jgi:hypothetical protein
MDGLAVSPFGELNTSTLELVLSNVGEDDALCSALVCRAFRLVLFSQPRVPGAGDPHPGARTLTRVAAVAASPARLHWARRVDEDALGVVGAGPAGPGWLLGWGPTTCSLLAGVGALRGLEWARAQRPPCAWDADTCMMAARGGHLACLQYAHDEGCAWDARTCEKAALKGFQECLHWARQNGCPWDERTTVSSGRRHLHILQWALDPAGGAVDPTGPTAASICDFAATCGNLAGLRWARSRGLRWNADTVLLAARNGRAACLRWALQQVPPCPSNIQVCRQAALAGHQECIEVARECGCEWEVGTCVAAAFAGHLELLQWLHTEGCPWGSFEIPFQAARMGHLECLRYALAHGCDAGVGVSCWAAHGGHLACLQLAHDYGCPCNAETMAYAAQAGHLTCMRLLRQLDCEWGAKTCERAAVHGHLECLRYAHEEGCAWNATTCFGAAVGGHLACLRYAHEEDCEWGDTCLAAAGSGNLECLRYAHTNGAAFQNDNRICLHAAGRGHAGCLRYALSSGFPQSAMICETAAAKGRLECLQVARVFGCVWDESTTANAEAGGYVALLAWARARGCPG